MPRIDEIAAASGLSAVMTRQQAKQAGQVREIAPDRQPAASVQQSTAFAAELLARSDQALSSVAEALDQALAIANEALATPRGDYAESFNRLLDKTTDDTAAATVQGHMLVGPEAKSISVATTDEGGKLILQAAPSDAQSLGVSRVGLWSMPTEIQQSIDQIQMALAQIASTQAKFAVLQGALNAALELSPASAGRVNEKETLLEAELAVYVGEEHTLRHARNILGFLEE